MRDCLYAAVSSVQRIVYLTANVTNVAQYVKFFKQQGDALQNHFLNSYNANVSFTVREPLHVTILGPIVVDASSPLYDDSALMQLITNVLHTLQLHQWDMPLHRIKSQGDAFPGYKFMDFDCYWYVANLTFDPNNEKQARRKYGVVLDILKSSLENMFDNVKITEGRHNIQYSDTRRPLLSLPLYQTEERFTPHMSLYNINWHGNFHPVDERPKLINAIYNVIGPVPYRGLPTEYTLKASDLKFSEKKRNEFVTLEPSSTGGAGPSSGRSMPERALATPWICKYCGWRNRAENEVCGGLMWEDHARKGQENFLGRTGHNRPCGLPRPRV